MHPASSYGKVRCLNLDANRLTAAPVAQKTLATNRRRVRRGLRRGPWSPSRTSSPSCAWPFLPRLASERNRYRAVSRCVKMCQDVARAANFTGKIGDPNLLVPPSPALAQVHMKNNRVQDQGNGHWEDHGSKGQEAKKRSTDINRNLQTVVGTGKLRQLPPPPSPPFDQFCRFHFQGSYGIMHLARAIKSNELGSV